MKRPHSIPPIAHRVINHARFFVLDRVVGYWFHDRLRRYLQSDSGADMVAALLTSSHESAQHMASSKPLDGHLAVIDEALAHAPPDGLCLEFGVFTGRSINHAADVAPHRVIHGFDSFRGLPEDWVGDYHAGHFDLWGALPKVRRNVCLHVGLFNETLPLFLNEHEGPIAYIYIDCDLYSSTKTIFDAAGDRFIAGSVIAFDEYFRYPGWEQHEYRAFMEFLERRPDVGYEHLAHDRRGLAVAVRLTNAS